MSITRPMMQALCLFLLAGLGLMQGGCRKIIEAPAPSNDVVASSVFADDASAQTAMLGFYNEAMDNPQDVLNGNIPLYAGLTADELGCLNPRAAEDTFQLNEMTASYTLSNNLFSSAYHLIYILNSLIGGVSQSQGMSAGMQTQLLGESKFLRAYLYFYLVELYGGVPLVTGTDYSVTAVLPRSSPDSIFRMLVTDLQSAQQGLPVNYITAQGYSGDRTRPAQASATALLARLYLYQQQWAAAEQAASGVINDARFRLEPSLDSVFLSTSREAIWQLQPVYDSLATADANIFQPEDGVPVYFLPAALVAAFEPGDLRKTHWVGSAAFGQAVYYYPNKYRLEQQAATGKEYEMALRLAEQYLIRAEARARQGNVAGAAGDLNTVRARAGLPAATASDQASLIQAIMSERRVELMTEWGHRWLDLKRTGQLDAVLGSKKGWKSTDSLYPIPGYELLGNPNMTQNPGY